MHPSDGENKIMSSPLDQEYRARLADAVWTVVEDYREGMGNPTATPEEALACTLREVDLDDIRTLQRSGDILPEVAAAYRAVLAETDEAYLRGVVGGQVEVADEARAETDGGDPDDAEVDGHDPYRDGRDPSSTYREGDASGAVAAARENPTAENLAAARAVVERERASAVREGAGGLVEDALDQVAAELAGLESGREAPPAASGGAGEQREAPRAGAGDAAAAMQHQREAADAEAKQQLALDVARVLRDYHESVGNYATPTAEVLAEVRAELERVDIAHLIAAGVVDAATAGSYTRVLEASAEDLASPAITSHAEGLVDGSVESYDFGNYAGADLEQGVDEWLEAVVTAESADADAACAAACAAAAAAQREAHAGGDTGAVAVVVVEDVEAPCDEDGGF